MVTGTVYRYPDTVTAACTVYSQAQSLPHVQCTASTVMVTGTVYMYPNTVTATCTMHIQAQSL